MAKRMGFSVVGLPHYTIWHLYEPGVDDLRHMEEMEEERKAVEKKEKEQAIRLERQKELFQDPKAQRELDNAAVQDILLKDKPPVQSPPSPVGGEQHTSGDGGGGAGGNSQTESSNSEEAAGKSEERYGAVESFDSGKEKKP